MRVHGCLCPPSGPRGALPPGARSLGAAQCATRGRSTGSGHTIRPVQRGATGGDKFHAHTTGQSAPIHESPQRL
ncbi:hypothetical protein SLNWT_2584 [Streptomyces albus]|uniref:Uncharacterized protein n=1 Tax=Streptomyces albus (strain ATCC 21838 / DSM 41398 / FERM P-419 / JCM 4703 / NBRC 107858) TaxID=1081613 RepID=A0A0B5EUQ1_STRA4|nr:hypothetical protein SLNWT_2584 [Streptomyces albus]AOU77272.1 hypothetical protein SLNHY_2581 [Streptomyces albus]AYN33047.1 hypothetical protein DUI70_2546 [Streptomyces albus]